MALYELYFKMKNLIIVINVVLLTHVMSFAQTKTPYSESKEFKINFNESGTSYAKLTFLNQVWMRYNESNPGSTVYNTPKNETYDIGLRRTRFQLFGALSKRVFFYTQFGLNNIAFNSPRKQGLFLLDATSDIKIHDRALSLGAGLTGWSGLSRYASPSVGTILMYDAPLYQQATNDVNDQFLRKLSIYAKGKIGKLDYRMILSNPMSVQKASASGGDLDTISSFSTLPGKLQLHGYMNYQFKDEESNSMPYTVGSYLGKKSVFNIGGGFLFQPDAVWHLNSNGDTVQTDLKLFSVDVFYDCPVNDRLAAITFYSAYQYSDYGKDYIRNVGAMNPSTGAVNGSLNGAGSAAPIIGSGHTFYGQIGYLFGKELLKDLGTIQPVFGIQLSTFQAYKDPVFIVDGGINWLLDGHRSKLSLNYQNRPVFDINNDGSRVVSERKSMIVLQYQISL